MRNYILIYIEENPPNRILLPSLLIVCFFWAPPTTLTPANTKFAVCYPNKRSTFVLVLPKHAHIVPLRPQTTSDLSQPWFRRQNQQQLGWESRAVSSLWTTTGPSRGLRLPAILSTYGITQGLNRHFPTNGARIASTASGKAMDAFVFFLFLFRPVLFAVCMKLFPCPLTVTLLPTRLGGMFITWHEWPIGYVKKSWKNKDRLFVRHRTIQSLFFLYFLRGLGGRRMNCMYGKTNGETWVYVGVLGGTTVTMLLSRKGVDRCIFWFIKQSVTWTVDWQGTYESVAGWRLVCSKS